MLAISQKYEYFLEKHNATILHFRFKFASVNESYHGKKKE